MAQAMNTVTPPMAAHGVFRSAGASVIVPASTLRTEETLRLNKQDERHHHINPD